MQQTRVRKWLTQHFTPQVVVFSSKTVQAKMMDQNGITPAEFLRPYGDVGNLGNYQIKTTDKTEPYKLDKFRVNFIDSHRMNFETQETSKIVSRIFARVGPEPCEKQDEACKSREVVSSISQ